MQCVGQSGAADYHTTIQGSTITHGPSLRICRSARLCGQPRRPPTSTDESGVLSLLLRGDAWLVHDAARGRAWPASGRGVTAGRSWWRSSRRRRAQSRCRRRRQPRQRSSSRSLRTLPGHHRDLPESLTLSVRSIPYNYRKNWTASANKNLIIYRTNYRQSRDFRRDNAVDDPDRHVPIGHETRPTGGDHLED